MAVVLPLLRRCGRRRIAEIMASAGLDDAPITGATDLDSVNSDGAREHLRRLNPELVVVSGTRLLSKKTSGSIPAPFLSIHMGISPGFRGAHGAYWALTKGRPDLAGTTIHFIDAGIDTGPVIKQGTFENHGAAFVRDISLSQPGDWNYLNLATGIPLLQEEVREVLAGTPAVRRVACDLPSTLYYQPTVCQYARRRIFGGVR
jgi:phosphoribosylglycinamide formyltransferase-1